MNYLHDVNRDIGIDLDAIPAVKYAKTLGRPPALGFSGTRQGMTLRQKRYVAALLEHLKPARADHGGCQGADAEFHAMLVQLPIEEVHIWWSNLEATWMPTYDAVDKHERTILVTHPPQPPLERNVDIVREKDLLIACPKETIMQLRSGTWSTVRYADQLGVKCLIVNPWGADEQ